MEKDQLFELLDRHPRYDYREMEDGAVMIADLNVSVDGEPDHHPLTRIEPYAIKKHDWPTIKAACTHGRDVRHASRVTGYFSWIEGWNVGKRAELQDRHRSTVPTSEGGASE